MAKVRLTTVAKSGLVDRNFKVSEEHIYDKQIVSHKYLNLLALRPPRRSVAMGLWPITQKIQNRSASLDF